MKNTPQQLPYEAFLSLFLSWTHMQAFSSVRPHALLKPNKHFRKMGQSTYFKERVLPCRLHTI